jgi:Flp pilus assembly protein CpaB
MQIRRRATPATQVDGTSAEPASAGTIGPHRGLPSSRAVVGGLLVTLAAVALFASYTGATTPSRETYLVAGHDIRSGQPIQAADLRLATMDLPPSTAQRAYRGLAELRGRVAVAPISSGDLITRTMVPDESPVGPKAQLSLALAPDRTVNGSLQAGDLVDVLVTYGTGSASSTEVVVARARLVDVPPVGDAQLGSSKGQTITLEVRALDDALKLVNASRGGEVTLVRTTSFRGEDYTSTTYAPSLPSPPTTGPGGR